jgi:hypothetical protein
VIRRTVPWTIALIAITAAGTANAQPSESARRFFTIYGGAQPQRHDLSARQSFPLFDETATVSSSQRIRNGSLFKAAVGIPIKGRLGIGAGVSVFGRPGTASLQAKVPDIVFFDRIRTYNFEAGDLKHKELGVHGSLLYEMAITPKVGLTFSIGPSLIRVRQDVAAVSVSSTGQPSVSTAEESGNAFGGNAGADVMYGFGSPFALGVFLHYAGGKVDLPSAPDVTVGGAQGGVAFRVAF